MHKTALKQQLQLDLVSAEQLSNKCNLIYQSEQSATSLTQV